MTEIAPAPDPEKEQRLATAISALDDRERNAYRYFLRTKQEEPGPVMADELFQLYLQGADCEQIRRQKVSLSLGQVVACRVIYDWDIRRSSYRSALEVNVPQRAIQTHLEQVDFQADLLTATRMKVQERVRQYLVTKDEKLLEDLPIPKTMRDYQSLFDMFLRATGQDKKKIEITGKVTHDHRTGTANAVSPEEAAGIIDGLMKDDGVIDVQAVPTPGPKKALAAPAAYKGPPRTPEEMQALLVRTGVPEEKARAMVESLGKDVKNLSERYADVWKELIDQKKGESN